MGEDAVVAAIDEVLRTAGAVTDAVARSNDVLASARTVRAGGASAVEVLDVLAPDGGADVRRQAGEAISAYLHAVMVLRACVIKTLIDDEGVSITHVATRLGVSRQMVMRLYQAAPGAPDH